MKRILISILLTLLTVTSYAQDVLVRINSGAPSPLVQTRVEAGITSLLTVINEAWITGTSPDCGRINITASAAASLKAEWVNAPFHTTDDLVVEPVHNTTYGCLQMRGIPMEVQSGDDGAVEYIEAAVDVDNDGRILDFHFGVEASIYRQVMKAENDVTDSRRRQMILEYVEQFRSAYDKKDIDFLEQVFSDDALIITGKVIRRKTDDLHMIDIPTVRYNVQNKVQYLSRLRSVFATSGRISVRFSEIKVSRHPVKNDYYGVLVHQDYTSSVYSDEGYVFLLWDFTDEYRPQIHVRTWQPYWMDEGRTKIIDESEIMDINKLRM